MLNIYYKAINSLNFISMKKPIKDLLLLLCFSCLLILGCQKDPSENGVIEPVDSSAVFNLAGLDTACPAIITNGNFLEGKKLTTTESIQIEVDISKVGKWSFSSDTLNGFSFAGSGTFANTGKQLITLNATGTPAAPGSFYFSITKGSLKKFFTISVLKSDIPTEMVPLKSYFKGTIGGVQYYVEIPTTGPDNLPHATGGGDTASFSSFVSPGIFPNPPGTGTLSLQKGFMYHFFTSTEADFKKFFQPGAYSFSTNKCNNNIPPGVIVVWSDANNQSWGTLRGFEDQAGSFFMITSIEDGHDTQGHYFVKVRSRFNCKLYNMRTNEMKELTDGDAVSFFIK
jgi:hypothetical protein